MHVIYLSARVKYLKLSSTDNVYWLISFHSGWAEEGREKAQVHGGFPERVLRRMGWEVLNKVLFVACLFPLWQSAFWLFDLAHDKFHGLTSHTWFRACPSCCWWNTYITLGTFRFHQNSLVTVMGISLDMLCSYSKTWQMCVHSWNYIVHLMVQLWWTLCLKYQTLFPFVLWLISCTRFDAVINA